MSSDGSLLPHFVIGGAPRSGTTSLAEALDAHPEVALAKPLVPEPKVMILEGPDVEACRRRYQSLFEPGDAQRVRGEKTTLYMESETVPALFDEVLPGARILFLVRDPVERAYSNWLWSRMNGREEESFERAIELELGQVERETRLPDWQQAYARPHDYLARGDYARFAQRWFEALGTERVRFFVYEQLIGPDADELFREVQAFVGVEQREPAWPTELVTAARDTGPPLDRAVRDSLREHMRPLVEGFAGITGIDVTPWGY